MKHTRLYTEGSCIDCGALPGLSDECPAKPTPPPENPPNTGNRDSDEERARLWALKRTHDKSWTFEMLYEGALWGLRTSRAELLAEREKKADAWELLTAHIRRLHGQKALECEHEYEPDTCLTELYCVKCGVDANLGAAREALKETE